MLRLPVLLAALSWLPNALIASEDPLAPHKTDSGILFQVHAPGARKVFLAGTFNDWLSNNEGAVPDSAPAMSEIPGTGVWTQTLPLNPGRYSYKFVEVDGNGNPSWFLPRYIQNTDEHGNAILWVLPDGSPFLPKTPNSSLRPEVSDGRVTFRFQDPGAEKVYLAGQFNNWAENNEGTVTDPDALMEGPNEEFIWSKTVNLPAGSYEYQFVIDGKTWVIDPNAYEQREDHSVVVVK